MIKKKLPYFLLLLGVLFLILSIINLYFYSVYLENFNKLKIAYFRYFKVMFPYKIAETTKIFEKLENIYVLNKGKDKLNSFLKKIPKDVNYILYNTHKKSLIQKCPIHFTSFNEFYKKLYYIAPTIFIFNAQDKLWLVKQIQLQENLYIFLIKDVNIASNVKVKNLLFLSPSAEKLDIKTLNKKDLALSFLPQYDTYVCVKLLLNKEMPESLILFIIIFFLFLVIFYGFVSHSKNYRILSILKKYGFVAKKEKKNIVTFKSIQKSIKEINEKSNFFISLWKFVLEIIVNISYKKLSQDELQGKLTELLQKLQIKGCGIFYKGFYFKYNMPSLFSPLQLKVIKELKNRKKSYLIQKTDKDFIIYSLIDESVFSPLILKIDEKHTHIVKDFKYLRKVISSIIFFSSYIQKSEKTTKSLSQIHFILENFYKSQSSYSLMSKFIIYSKEFLDFDEFHFLIFDKSINGFVPYESFSQKFRYHSKFALDSLVEHFIKKRKTTIIREKKDYCRIIQPLVFKEEILGVVYGSFPKKNTYKLKIFFEMTSIFILYLKNFFLSLELQNRLDQLESLHIFSKSLATSFEKNQVLIKIFQFLSTILSFDKILFYDLEEESSQILLEPDGFFRNIIENDYIYPKLEDVINKTIIKKAVVYKPNFKEENFEYKSVLSLPLQVESNKIIGILLLLSSHPYAFSSNELDTLKLISTQLSITLKNVSLVNNLKKAQEQLFRREKMEALGTMASGIAHDINNFLTGIMGNLEIILNRKDLSKKSILQYVKIAYDICNDGANLVRRLQDLTRIRKISELKKVNINYLIKETIEALRFRWYTEAVKNNIKYDVIYKFGDIPEIYGSLSDLKSVFMNLANNAFDAMPEGGKLIIKTYCKNNTIYIHFKDTGVGIPKMYLDKIFEPFFTTKGEKGTGLGLVEVQNIIIKHRGTIKVISEENKGTEFIITLPVIKKVKTQKVEKKEFAEVKNLNLMVVEDEKPILDLLVEILQTKEHKVYPFTDSLKALEFFKDNYNKINMILTDIGLSKMDGWELAERIREISDIPIIFVSGWALNLEDEKIKKIGINGVISKPFELKKLFETINEVYTEYKRRKEK